MAVFEGGSAATAGYAVPGGGFVSTSSGSATNSLASNWLEEEDAIPPLPPREHELHLAALGQLPGTGSMAPTGSGSPSGSTAVADQRDRPVVPTSGLVVAFREPADCLSLSAYIEYFLDPPRA